MNTKGFKRFEGAAWRIISPTRSNFARPSHASQAFAVKELPKKFLSPRERKEEKRKGDGVWEGRMIDNRGTFANRMTTYASTIKRRFLCCSS